MTDPAFALRGQEAHEIGILHWIERMILKGAFVQKSLARQINFPGIPFGRVRERPE